MAHTKKSNPLKDLVLAARGDKKLTIDQEYVDEYWEYPETPWWADVAVYIQPGSDKWRCAILTEDGKELFWSDDERTVIEANYDPQDGERLISMRTFVKFLTRWLAYTD